MPAAQAEDQHHDQGAEENAEQPSQDDVGRARHEEECDQGHWMDDAPVIVEALQVPLTRTPRSPKANLFRQICDLPVVINIAVPTVPGVLCIGQEEDCEKAWRERD